RYIPPSLRQNETESEDEQVAAIRKVLQGQLNRLSETNIEAIVLQVESLYIKYPRHHVTDVLASLLLQSIQSRIHMLDTFLYVNAALVGAVYRIVGLDPVAHLVQKLMEEFEKHFNQGLSDFKATAANDDMDDGDEMMTGKQCQNLCVFIAELYNFQVISCQLVYDVVRLCIQDVNEFTAELLLRLIRISGIQLRKDDPLALKGIVQKVNEMVNAKGAKSFSVRCQFMFENLMNLKDNRMRNAMSQNADNVAKLKRLLGNMDKRRTVGAVEPINIGLDDIREVETKGKWWLVGASWVGNQYTGDDSNNSRMSEAAQAATMHGLQSRNNSESNSEMERLLKLAREQHMNTDVRRSIFITLLSSDDYTDAFERLLKLDLKKTQAREVVRVLLHCCGQEKAYNPYYTLVAFKLCSYHNSYRHTLQYALWDFLRELGESDVGGLGRIGQESDSVSANVPLRRIVNTAKLYGWLIDKQVLSLLILKTVTFAKVGYQARTFFQIMFSTLFL
ncbi:armadillo-type protein, partial [Coemansia spiralis]